MQECAVGAIEDVREIEVVHLVEGVAIAGVEIEDLAAGEEMRLVVEDVPAASRRHDHDLVEIVLVQGKQGLRSSRLHDHELRLCAEEIACTKLQQATPPAAVETRTANQRRKSKMNRE